MIIIKIKTIVFSLILFVLISVSFLPQDYSSEDVEIANSKFQLAADKKLFEFPINEVIVEIGRSFLGTEYVAHSLEKPGEEQLVINLTGLDCTTFLETALCFARCIKKNKAEFQDYTSELTLIRYRDGIINGYPSRLHYFSDWIFDNQKKGIIQDITEEIGGEKIRFKVNFMSENPKYYSQLANNPEFIPVIVEQEEQINSREYFYVDENNIKSVEAKIQNGDLIALTTNEKGLDISHVGLAVKMRDDRIHFLHAPQKNSKVQITEEPLADYVLKIKRHTGIIVLRVNEPKKDRTTQ